MSNTSRYELRNSYTRQFGKTLQMLHCQGNERLETIGRACINARFHGFSQVQPEVLFESLEEIAEKTNGQFSLIVDSLARQVYETARSSASREPKKDEVQALTEGIAYLREIKSVYTNLTRKEGDALAAALERDVLNPGAFRRMVRELLSSRTSNRTHTIGPFYGVYRGYRINHNG